MKRESERIKRKVMTAGLVFAIILGTGILAYNIDNLYLNSRHNIMSYLPDTVFIDGSNTGFVRVLEPDGSAAAGQRVRLWACEPGGEKRLVWEGKTDDMGEVYPSFTVPDMNYTSIVIDTEGESIERTVRTDSHLQIYISTDKPLYKSGQSVHIRVLALNENAGPYEGQVTLEISAPSGDVIFRKIQNTSTFGITSLDFPLAPVLPQGAYKISVTLLNGDENTIKANKVFTVADYVLPKFNIDIIGLQGWYAPNIPISGTVTCDYIFGKHVRGIVSVDLMTYDGSWTRTWSMQSSLIDGEYGFTVPEEIISDISERAWAISYISLNVTVTDESGHMESDSKLIPFSTDVISITAIGDRNYVGLNSTYHFITRYPDGSPIPSAEITLESSSFHIYTTLYTDERGVASYTFTYKGDYYISVTASKDDYEAHTYYNLRSLQTGIKAVADKNRYSVGDEAVFDVFYDGDAMSDWFYYEASQNGVVVSSGKGELSSGHATITIPITADLAPVGSFSVYKINENGGVESYSTIFGVDYSMPLSISVNTDKEVYKPKDDTRINFHVENGSDGVVAALGVSIIDSAVMEMMQRISGTTGFDEVERVINGEVSTPRDILYNYVYADTGYLPSESDSFYDGEETNISMTSNWHSVLINAQNYRSEAVNAYWNLIASLFILGFIGMVYMSLKEHQSKYDRAKRKRITVVALVITLVLLSVIASAVLYVMTMGMTGSCSSGGIDEGIINGDSTTMPVSKSPPESTGLDYGISDADWLTTENGISDGDGDRGVAEDLRQYFPETWYWNPTLITDENGDANLSISAPDSITTWLLRAVASDKNGELGYTQSNITVFKEFFIEPDLPTSVVAGDAFRLRVMVYNYNSTPADVAVSLTPASWFSADNGTIKEITVPANSVRSCYFNIQVEEEAGLHHITVSGNNRHSIDTVSREIRVAPYGKEIYDVRNGELSGLNSSTELFVLQDGRVPGGDTGYVVIQGISEGVALEGAENFIGYVSGCGEQSMSRLSVNILAFNLIKNKEGGDKNMMEYESMVVQGIQHELTFLVKDGSGRGIVWFPSDSSPHPWLTSWGLITFQDAIDAGFTIDPKIIEDMQNWLVAQQNPDGSFNFPEQGLYETTNPILRSKEIATTAYITRALLYSGMDSHDKHIEDAAKYIADNIDDVWDDPYSLSVCLIALNRAEYSSSVQTEIAAQIDAMKIRENNTLHWESQTSMISDSSYSYYGYSSARIVETTGYAVLALNTQGYSSDVRDGIQYLIGSRSELGLFSSTQDTVVALQAIIHASGNWKEGSTLEVTVSVDNNNVKNLTITRENADITHIIDITQWLSGRFHVSFNTNGAGSVYYRVVVAQVIPWNEVPEEKNELELSVEYSALSVSLYDSVTATMKLTYTGSAPEMKMALVHIECPAGMEFYPSEFSELVNSGTISYYEMQGHSVDIYLENIPPNSPIILKYTLTAINTGTYTLQGIYAYDMYEPDNCVEIEPVIFQLEQ